MSCDDVQLALSGRLDGEHVDERGSASLDEHLSICARCRAFVRSAEHVRNAVRIRAAQPVPDLVDRIVGELEALPSTRSLARRGSRPSRTLPWRRAMPAAAALVAGAVIGSVLVGGPFRGRDPGAISANAVVQGVRGASPALDSFDGTFDVVERGLGPDVPVRRLTMRLAFLAPQRFRLDLEDHTDYPSASRVPTDVTYIQDVTTTFLSGPTGCPADLPAGSCPVTRTTLTTGSTPGDLLVPATTFATPDGFRVLGAGRIDGHDVVRVELPFARAAPMLPFLWLDDTWRPFFRNDRVEVELDASTWLPRRISVFPAATEARRAWELRFGLPPEEATTPILEVAASSVAPAPPDGSLFEMPGGTQQDLSVSELEDLVGYRPAVPAFTADLELATSVAPPPGRSAPRSILVFADGLDYLRVGERPGPHDPLTFDRLGRDPIEVVLPGGGIGYYAPAVGGRASRLAIGGDETSILLESNLPRHEVVAIAGSMPVRGRPLP